MAENIELIAAANLPTTEAEEVSVLCLDNGELKQKPGASFCGGGGYVVVANELDIESASGVVNESYDNFINVLLAGGTVWIDASSLLDVYVRFMATGWMYDEDGMALLAYIQEKEVYIHCPNGTWTPEG